MHKYLDPVAVSRLANMQIRARQVVEGYFAGMHKSPLKGNSTDFADYRRYAPGDDLRHIDWKVLAKTDRYYIKEFEEQTSMSCFLLLDVSNSMDYAGHGAVTKLQYGCYIAAALAYLMVKQQDNVGLFTFSDQLHVQLPPRRGPGHLERMLGELEEAGGGGNSAIAESLGTIGARLRRRGLLVVISDLLDDPEQTLEALKLLRGMKNELIVFHLLDREEIDFPFNQLMEFEDMETGGRMIIDCEAVRRAYRARLDEFVGRLERECTGAGIDYLRVNTAETFHELLAGYILKRGMLRR